MTTVATAEGRGIAIPSSRSPARWNSMASRIRCWTSSRVPPAATQPGSSGLRAEEEPVVAPFEVVGLRVGGAAGSLRGERGGGMVRDGQRAGTASGFAFDLGTAVRGEGERWTAEVGDGWTVAGRPNGGYLLALVA